MEDSLEDAAATGLRVTRGGGWSVNRKMVRCAYWNCYNPWRVQGSLLVLAKLYP
jgi:formylglycine-generating enzyme required for sulfatase activity